MKNKKFIKLFAFVLSSLFLAVPLLSSAADEFNYTPLENIPGTATTSGDFYEYVQAIYKFGIWAVGIAALLMITIGGFMYITSAGNTASMGKAKGVITDAIIGIVLALTAYLLLYIINPDLVTIQRLSPISTPPPVIAPVPEVGAPPAGAQGCGGFSPQAGIVCADASPKLTNLLTCIKLRGINTTVSSISDSAGFSRCKNAWDKPPCAHVKTSCHYGGGPLQQAEECQDSHAADLSIRDSAGAVSSALADAIVSAAKACGARVNDERNRSGAPHIHVSNQTSCCAL